MNYEIDCSIMCRACMKVDGVLLPMYGDEIIAKKNLPKKLADLASIEIDKYDGLPTVLCPKCAYRTDSFFDFKLQVQATEKKLRKMFQNSTISPKLETVTDDWESDEYLTSEDTPQEKVPSKSSQTLTNSVELQISIRESIFDDEASETVDVKPTLGEELQEDSSCVESLERSSAAMTIQYGGEPTEEINEFTALQNRDDIFIPSISEIIDDRSIKSEVSDEIKNLLQSQNIGYTYFYISAEDAMTLGEQDNRMSIGDDSEPTLNPDDERIFDPAFTENPITDDNVRETACANDESLPMSSDDAFNRDETRRIGKWTSDRSYDNFTNDNEIEATDPKISDTKSNENTSTNNDEDESESDYFVDPKDNLLGSLNDTIMRIKEIKTEGSDMHYQCTMCMQNYDKLTGVLIHTVDNHVPSSGPFFCVVCEKDCETHRELRSHVKTHNGQFPYACFICNKAYSMKRYLKRHMSCHTDFPRYRCPKCGLRFNAKAELEIHVRTHVQGAAPFACSQCPRVFNHKGNYKRHLISHLDPHGLHLPKYPCEVCGKRFLNNRTLATHMRVHTGEKPFKCDICERSFSQQGNLLNHLRIHSNPRSYTCEVCGKRFNQRATLRDHGLLHTGEKPYVCNVCGVAFTFSAALRRHMWTHATDKPFGCEICNARFVGKYDIKRHMKIHTDRPKTRRKGNQSRNENVGGEDTRDETEDTTRITSGTQTIYIEQVLLPEDATQIVTQEESEKENVDALFNLIQYG